MIKIMDYPLLVFVISFVALWLATWIGVILVRRRHNLDPSVREDFGFVLTATLTLLALIIGFTFSMAVSRYDQRKNLEEEEANAIGTEYVRADLLHAADANKVRALLRDYLDQRVLHYSTRDALQIRTIDARTAQLQADLWAAIITPAAAQPTPAVALTVSGMNDVLNSQGYAQAAAWNRIPVAAWSLMGVIAVLSCLGLGYGARKPEAERLILMALPVLLSIAFFLIADIDSPLGGVIRVNPQNLESLVPSLRGP